MIKGRGKKIAYGAVVALSIAAFLAVFLLNANDTVFFKRTYMHWLFSFAEPNQYALLADALIEGKFVLDLPVSPDLAALPNPYDFKARAAFGSEENPIFWDHAFYKGQYYSYFGVVPAVFLYVPVKLLTGQSLPTPYAIAIIGTLTIVAMALLVYRIAKRYFGDTANLPVLIVAFLVTFAASNVCYLAFVARFYSVPILSSILCTSLGLWFWFGARKEMDYGKQNYQLSSRHLFLGSFFMALNFGCRPQFMLASFLAFAVFGTELFKDRSLVSIRSAKQTVCALLPYVLVIAPLVLYNYLRFGSLFDFGSHYNLTGFDMNSYKQPWSTTLSLLYSYSLQPLTILSQFPYFDVVEVVVPKGWAPTEPSFGGFLILNPCILLTLVLALFAWRKLKESKLLVLGFMLIAFAVIVCIVDTRVAGFTQRYFSDFGLYLALAFCFAFMALHSKVESRVLSRRALLVSVSCLTAITLIVGGLTLLSPYRYDSVYNMNPQLWESIAEAVNDAGLDVIEVAK